MDWRSFETAPKDGSRIDLWAVNVFGEGKRFPDCHWSPFGGTFRWIGLREDSRQRWKATHWMPIPAPPK